VHPGPAPGSTDLGSLSEEYGHLRAGKRRFAVADAMHLPAAVRAKCDYLMTHDNGYPTKQVIEGITVRRPAVVWAETLFDTHEQKSLGVQSRPDARWSLRLDPGSFVRGLTRAFDRALAPDPVPDHTPQARRNGSLFWAGYRWACPTLLGCASRVLDR
jgi:hypothetical protein